MTINLSWAQPIKSNEDIYSAAGLTDSEIAKMPRYIAGIDDFYGTPAFAKLYNFFVFDASDIIRMPYDVAKGRTGTPDDWILEVLNRG